MTRIRRGITLLAFVATIMLFILPATGVYAAPVLQESYDGSNDQWWTPKGSIIVGQTFTAGSNHTVTSVKFNILFIGGTPGDIYVYLMATSGGIPTGSYLSTAVRSTYSTGWQEWTFTSPYAVTSGDVYALAISAPSSNDSNNINLWMEVPGAYGDGQAVYSMNGGGSWSSFSGGDLDFEVYGEDVAEFGDAPDPTYPTLLASNGARHTASTGLCLGSAVDYEADGQPSIDATGDDLSGADDEDGINFTTPLVTGQTASIDVTSVVPAATTAVLNAWIDFDNDGNWDHPGEQILTNQSLTGGLQSFDIAVPSDASLGTTFARFRISSDTGLQPSGLASDGEVEDYQVTIVPPTEEEPTPPPEEPGGEAVGIEVYPADKSAIIAPWIGLGVALAACGIYLVRRRNRSYR